MYEYNNKLILITESSFYSLNFILPIIFSLKYGIESLTFLMIPLHKTSIDNIWHSIIHI